MSDVDKEFENFNKLVLEEEEKYRNTEVKMSDYDFPHIYLTESEIEEFNKDCEKNNIDIKVVPLADYMNINSPSKYLNNEDENIDDRLGRIESLAEYLGNHFLKNKGKPKKKEKEEENEDIDMEKDGKFIKNKVINYLKKNEFKMKKEFPKDESDKNLFNNSEEEDKDDHSFEDDSGENSEDKGKKVKKKNTKLKKEDFSNEKFNSYFKRIRATKQVQDDDAKRKPSLIKEILDNSQLLTPEELKSLAKNKHISMVDDTTLSEYDLKKKDIKELDRINVDLNFNSNILKLNNDNKESIKRKKERIEREKKSKEDYLEKKKMKGQKKIPNYFHVTNNFNQDNKEDQNDKDISEDKSMSEEDSI